MLDQAQPGWEFPYLVAISACTSVSIIKRNQFQLKKGSIFNRLFQIFALSIMMPSETDVAPKAISGLGIGFEISGQGYAKSTFGAKKF